MADSKRISDLETNPQLNINDLMYLSAFVSDEVYESKKASLAALALAMLGDFTLENLTTTSKNVVGAINEIVEDETETVEGITFRKIGKTVQIYGYKTGLPTGAAVTLATKTKFKSLNYYSVLPIFGASEPYAPIGSIWISNNGTITIYKPTATTNVYISGNYNCQ